MTSLPEGVIPLAVGTVLALVGLAVVLSPLVNDGSDSATRTTPILRSRATPEVAAIPIDADPVEAAIRRARARQQSCVSCGPRVEPDATYCSHCGTYLPAHCPHCNAPVTEPGAAFCIACGDALNPFV